jgi:hypothetical protein
MVTARPTFHFLYWGQHHLYNWQLGGIPLVMVMVVMLLVVSAIHHYWTRGTSTRPTGTVHVCKLVLTINHFFGNIRRWDAWPVLQSHRHG